MRERLAIVLGVLVVGAGVAVVLSRPAERSNGTNARVSVSGSSLPVGPRPGRRCQYGEYVPPDSGRARVYLNTLGRAAGPLEVVLSAPDGRSVTGRLPVGRHTGPTDIPFPRVDRAMAGASVCFFNRGPTAVTLAGDFTPPNPFRSGVLPYDRRDDARIDWRRPGKQSWWSFADTAAHRFALFKAGPVGPWTFYALVGVFLVLAVLAVGLVVRDPEP